MIGDSTVTDGQPDTNVGAGYSKETYVPKYKQVLAWELST